MANTNAIETKTTFGTMLKKVYLVGVLTAATIGMVPFAAEANPCCQRRSGGDNAVVQTSEQQATVTGKGNSIQQNSSQSNRGGRSTSGNQGVVQDQYQSADSSGYGNHVNQSSRQNNQGQNNKPAVSRRNVHRPDQRPVHRPASTCNNTCAKKGI